MRECVVCKRELVQTQFYGRRKKCKECYKKNVINSRRNVKDIAPEDDDVDTTMGELDYIPDLTETSLVYHRPDPDEGDEQVFPLCVYLKYRDRKILTDGREAPLTKTIAAPGVEIITRDEYLRLSDTKGWRRTPAWNFVRIVKEKPKPFPDDIRQLFLLINKEDRLFAIVSAFEYKYYYKLDRRFKHVHSSFYGMDIARMAYDLYKDSYCRASRNGFARYCGIPSAMLWEADD